MKRLNVKLSGVQITTFLLVCLSFAFGIYFIPHLPDQVAIHWNIYDQADGFGSPFWGTIMFPIIILFIFLLITIIPLFDPLQKNIAKFKKQCDLLVLALTLFFFYVFELTIIRNLGAFFEMSRYISPALGLLFYFLGSFMKDTKRNWTIGIRTPWTIGSDKVWEETHKMGGVFFKISGIMMFLGIPFGGGGLLAGVFAAVLFSIYTVIYSYRISKKR